MRIGFIGTGNMALAIIGGIIKNGLVKAGDIIAFDKSEENLKKAVDNFGIVGTRNNIETVKEASVLFLAVKPQFYEEVIEEIKEAVSDSQLIITIAPGKTLKWLEEKFARELKIIRTMPNTPALVGAGITAVTPNKNVTPKDLDLAMDIFNTFGSGEVISENLMDAVVSVASSSPAYVFMMIEAMADAAVLDGMPRAQAYKFAASAVYGSAKMVLETGKHPASLKDMVCSPAGTTIEAVKVLEKEGFRSSLIEAMAACSKKAREL
ncbi:pyrroline-5-carboxylate reductase [Acetitomaculum ruminis DSM 5522]|uniref:Pyrroline-5-carboxylate reductase n=1 Tax=Acetitomaculum ruminis DSM 5522 TaxID=1120918 RepID=A0A1I0Y049_9FIRM|nr:pyrroline-5-carboxylate reductase [Acetitomaculum ruminis]SFB06514.1 pyrroline-5-carboxylate reductase [Acetitomaculum ruminis DSM 5522]